jgi:hypothetical protein
MSNANCRVEPYSITIHPHLGTGWETVLNQMDQEITMQLKLLGFRLPLRRRFPYSQVVRIGTVCRESWWSWALTPLSGWFGHSLLGGGRPERTAMPTKGWRHDILVTLKSGRKPIKIGTVKSPDIANEIERESRRRLGLSET